MEEWRDVKGYEGIYQVSNEGRVKALERYVDNFWGTKQYVRERILKSYPTKGYLTLSLSKNGVPKKFYVHRLVAEAFITNPNNYPQINHRDENTQNNKVENLEWCDSKYNMNYGTIKERCKLNQPKRKKVFQYTLDGDLVKIWCSSRECGKDGFIQSGVSACCRGKIKNYKGFIWRYTNDMNIGLQRMVNQ